MGIDFHVANNLNDGRYGNSNSWIGGNQDAPVAFAGIQFPEPVEVASVAWGRDNGNNFTDACGGQCTDRSLGTYLIQYTQVAEPNENTLATENFETGWATVGTQSPGAPIWEVVAGYLRDRETVEAGRLNTPRLVNVAGNPGIADYAGQTG